MPVIKSRQPNIIFIQADQWAAFAGGRSYDNQQVKTPNIDGLARNGVVFRNFYCNSPLCAPSRFSMLSGRLPSAIGAYDNAAEFASSVPTYAHYLRLLGYHTCLSGKMHFIGADQMHGFEQRLTTDIYPADFGWTVNWEKSEERIDWWYHNMLSVKQAGVAEITNQLEYDDEVGHQAIKYLYARARRQDPRPFALTISFTHPHDPYATRREFWNRYDDVEIEMPRVPAMDYTAHDPHSQRIYKACAMDKLTLSSEDILRARRAYYGNISYLDDWVGKFLDVLEKTGLRDDTIIMLSSDHGDMLGERGLWYKMSFFDGASKIPFIVSAPEYFKPNLVYAKASLLDLLPTFVAMAGGEAPGIAIDGRSLVPLLKGQEDQGPDEVIGEYMGEGSIAPLFMIRRGPYKFIWSSVDPAQLYDLEKDPDEQKNLAGHPDYKILLNEFEAEISTRWNSDQIYQQVIENQRQRRLVSRALSIGKYYSWDYQPHVDAGRQFMRNHLDLNEVEANSRYPRPRHIEKENG